MSDELDEIRKRRMQELQDQNESAPSNEETIRQQEEAKQVYEERKQAILRSILSEEAKQRLSNIKLVKPQMAENIENQLIQLSQSGRINGRISEQQLLNLLRQLQDNKRDSSITFKRV